MLDFFLEDARFFPKTSFPDPKSYSDVRKHIPDTSRRSRRVQNTILISKTYFLDKKSYFWIFRSGVPTHRFSLDPLPPGESSTGSKNLCFSLKPKNTFLISKSYSEHVSNVDRCRECVFEHQNTFWDKETTFFGKSHKNLAKICPLRE